MLWMVATSAGTPVNDRTALASRLAWTMWL
jgi:hypothetical protein